MPRGIPDPLTEKYKLDKSLRTPLLKIKHEVETKRHPAIIVVSGYQNRGKTLNTSLMCEFLQEDFDPEKQIGKGMEQFLDSWEHTKNLCKKDGKVRCCVFDEIGEYCKGGNRRSVKEINNIFTTFKQHKIILFIVGVDWWLMNKGALRSGAFQMLVIIDDYDYERNYAYYHWLDANDALFCYGQANKAAKNSTPNSEMWYGYHGKASSQIKGFIKGVSKDRVKYYDKISDFSKEEFQIASAARLRHTLNDE